VEIAIISHTHMPRGNRRLPAAGVSRLRRAEMILHASDLMRLSVLRELRKSVKSSQSTGTLTIRRFERFSPHEW
jgi:predicted phosphodiesterase